MYFVIFDFAVRVRWVCGFEILIDSRVRGRLKRSYAPFQNTHEESILLNKYNVFFVLYYLIKLLYFGLLDIIFVDMCDILKTPCVYVSGAGKRKLADQLLFEKYFLIAFPNVEIALRMYYY